jgi:hypothetical protein
VKYNRQIDRIAELDISAIVGAHAPITTGKQIEDGIAMLRELPFMEPAQLPRQPVLEEILKSIGAVPA